MTLLHHLQTVVVVVVAVVVVVVVIILMFKLLHLVQIYVLLQALSSLKMSQASGFFDGWSSIFQSMVARPVESIGTSF